MKDFQILDPHFNRITVKGYIDEPFGINKSSGDVLPYNKWNITHLNTGAKLGSVHLLKDAWLLIKELKALGNLEFWDQYSVHELYKERDFLQKVVTTISNFTGRKRVLKDNL